MTVIGKCAATVAIARLADESDDDTREPTASNRAHARDKSNPGKGNLCASL